MLDCTVPSEVQNLVKVRNFGQNFPFFEVVNSNSGFCRNLNLSVHCFDAKQMFHTLKT